MLPIMVNVIDIALSLGFDACGVAKAQRLDRDAAFMDKWVDSGYAGKMDYLERNRDKRYDIRELVPGAKSVIVCLLTYEHSGKDYHRTVKSKLYELQAAIEEALNASGEYDENWVNRKTQHIFCDSAPVLERRWAQLAGLGFIGRNHQLIHPTLGSYVHPGELVTNIDLTASATLQRRDLYCLSCNACVDACPGQALGGEVWDPRKCIAYDTHRCTVCQEVCPFNRPLR